MDYKNKHEFHILKTELQCEISYCTAVVFTDSDVCLHVTVSAAVFKDSGMKTMGVMSFRKARVLLG